MVRGEDMAFSQAFVDRFFLKWPLCRPFGHRCTHAFTLYGHLDKYGQSRIYCRKTHTAKGTFTIASRPRCPIRRW